jgi:tRNA pseudouridine55 synthase
MTNRLFVAKKPLFIGSNAFLSVLKRKYGVKSGGFSGSLDPCAKGSLIVAFGQYTRLFQYLAKTPKRYRATFWLGAQSESLDIERVSAVEKTPRLDEDAIVKTFDSFIGESEQYAPAFSAIRINGTRSYKLARKGENVETKPRKTHIYDLKITAYAHPFLSFECAVSEGCYIRSLARDIAAKLNTSGSLSYLERLNEGRFFYENERALNPLDFIDLERNRYEGDRADLFCGKRAPIAAFEKREEGDYLVECGDFFVIIAVANGEVSYKLGRVDLARA